MRASSPRRITARACQSLPSRFTRGRSPSIEGMARRKAQTYGSAILSDHGGRLSARHMCSSSKAVAHVICDVGRRQAPLLPEVGFAASERQLAPSRTSYWVRERTPPPPESLTVRQPARTRRISSRLRNASRERPSTGRGACSLSAAWKAEISLLALHVASRHPGLVPGIHDLAALPPANRGWRGHDKSTGANYWRMRRAPRGSTRT